MDNSSVVDFSSLRTFTGDNKDLMKVHINTFLAFAPAQVEKLKEKLQEEDWAELSKVAHKLKPKCAYMGIKSAETAAKTIELNAADQKELDKMPELVSNTEAIINRAITELKTFVNS